MSIEVIIKTTRNKEGEARLDDTVWFAHLPHEVGFCRRAPGGAFVGVYYHLDQSELDAVRYGLDERDQQLFPECGRKNWPERKMANPPAPEVFQRAVATVQARRNNQQLEEEGPSIYVPETY